ncbi:hypothetical protein QL285_070354 [Trifolium repens]|nr:hypothetical protein QL285_070354 [Trifolium repens]
MLTKSFIHDCIDHPVFCFSYFTKRVIPSVSDLEMSPSNIFHKRVIPSVSGVETPSSKIFQVAGFANNQFAKAYLISPKSSSVCLVKANIFLVMSCSPTMIADKYFSLLCPALLQ